LDVNALMVGAKRPYRVSIVTNRDRTSPAAVVRDRPAGSDAVTTTALGIDWPHDVYSLTHIALPFPPDDPLYGLGSADNDRKLNLGRIMLRGENGALRIPSTAMTRQHWNPFYPYVEQRIGNFLKDVLPH
jgi:hypothetical protein